MLKVAVFKSVAVIEVALSSVCSISLGSHVQYI